MKKSKPELPDSSFPDCKVADEFAESFFSGELKLKPEADFINYYDEKGDETSLIRVLPNAVANYISAKSEYLRIESVLGQDPIPPLGIELCVKHEKEANKIKECRDFLLICIAHAKSLDLLIETETMASKLKKSEHEKEELKRLNDSLEKLNRDLKKENNRLHTLFPDKDKGKTEVGGFE